MGNVKAFVKARYLGISPHKRRGWKRPTDNVPSGICFANMPYLCVKKVVSFSLFRENVSKWERVAESEELNIARIDVYSQSTLVSVETDNAPI